MSYTKGLRVRESAPRVVEDERGVVVARVCWPGFGTGVAAANALMFVAAVPMLEALEAEERHQLGILPEWPCPDRLGPLPSCCDAYWCERCVTKMNDMRRAAIALAKGEKP